MAIFSTLSGFFNRNKRRILLASTIGISTYYIINYFIIKKFRKFQDSLRQELFIKEQIKRRFIQTQNDCYYTLIALLPVLVNPIINNSPTELITKALKLKKSGGSKEISDSLLTTDNLTLHSSTEDHDLSLYLNKSKTDLWKLLKVKTILRFLTLIYSTSSLLLLTRLQLNILARKSYLQSAILMTNESIEIDSNENYIVEQSYLSLSWWLLNKGWESLSYEIEARVEEIFKPLNARTELSLQEFTGLLQECVNTMNMNQLVILDSIWPRVDNLNLTLLNTNPSLINEYNDEFLKLINETNLITHNESFMNNLNQMVFCGIETLFHNLSPLTEDNLKLANILAQLSNQCELLVNNDEQNEFINKINELECLDDFSASIYSNIE